MANISGITGFQPARAKYTSGYAPLVFALNANNTADTTNNHGDIYIGDPVKLSSGLVQPANSNDTIYGVVVAIGFVNTADPMPQPMFNWNNPGAAPYVPYTAAASTYVIGIALATQWLFTCETNTALSLVPGSTADITNAAATAHGSETTGMSSCRLTTSSNADIIVHENLVLLNNDTTLQYAKHLVEFKKTLTI